MFSVRPRLYNSEVRGGGGTGRLRGLKSRCPSGRAGSNPARRTELRPQRDRNEVQRLHKLGLNQCQIAGKTGIPRSTLREWLHPRYVPKGRRVPRLDLISLPKHHYAYLLGFYLGDGTITRQRRGVYRLRIVCDSRYPNIVDECAIAMAAVMPDNRVLVQKLRFNAFEIGCSSKLWPLLFPQHGLGPKHTRKIELVPWQERAIARFPWQFVRGLIHSDGCRVINRVNGGEYPRYLFSQVSDDIRKIFCDTLDFICVEWKQNKWNSISVARRRSVELLDSFIGPKA